MQVGGITCTSQRFALTRCNCSSQEKKTRQRKSKEERRAMVETFITKHRNTNNGRFPSLNLTHKEVGGSFYIVREIVRDIIQENRVLGPGDLDMQSLTLEDVPIQPEICENDRTSIGTELQLETGNEEDYILVESELLNLDLTSEKNFEQMEVLDSNLVAEEDCANNTGKQPTDDVLESDFHEKPKIEMKKGEIGEVSEIDGTLPFNEAIKVDSFVEPTETSDSNGGIEGSSAVENGDLQELVVEMRTESIEKSNFEIKKGGRGESSEGNNGKMPLNENKKSNSVTGSTESWGSNGVFEMARAVVQVEQFPLPRANISLSSEDPDSVSGKEREKELVEVKASAVVISETEIKQEFENLSLGKSLERVPKAEQGATLNNAIKTEGQELNPRTPICEYLLHRHESYLKLDFLTHEISMDASSNRESAEKKKRAKAENNPFWNTVRAFVTAIVKFWSE